MTFTDKLLTSQPPIEVAGRRFKRYHVTSEIAPVTADIERAATELLPKLAPEADRTPPAGFIVLHGGRRISHRTLKERLLSADDGATWETNWVKETTRTEETP